MLGNIGIGRYFFGRDTRCDMISKRRRPHDNHHLNCLRERSSTAELGEGSEGVGKDVSASRGTRQINR